MAGPVAKILALLPDAFDGPGGIAQYNRDLLSAWAEADEVERIDVLPRNALSAEQGTRDDKITQIKVGKSSLAYTAAAVALSPRQRYDAVFIGHLYLSPVGALAAKLSGAATILQLHGIEAWPKPNPVQCLASERADYVFSVSRHTRFRFLEHVALPPDRALVIPNTFRREFSPGLPSSGSLVPQGRKLILSVGRLASTERYKGHDLIIQLLPELIASHPSLLYVVAGAGDDLERLCRLAEQLGVLDAVWFAGKVPLPALVDLYRAATLFVLPSSGEGFGIVFLEAMACGTPVIALDQGGVRDPLLDGEIGRLAAKHELLLAVREALDGSPGLSREMLAMRVRDAFGPESFARRARAALRLVLSTRDLR